MPGGYDTTRWPIVVPPVDEEHPVTWLWRLGHRYGLTVTATLRAVGLATGPAALATMERKLAPHAQTIGSHVGPHPHFATADEPAATGSVLEQQLLGYLDRYRPARSGDPAPTFRYCPPCLAETGGAWQRSWLTRLPGLCGHHQVTLAAACPRCEAVPFATTAWMSATAPPWTCPQITGQQLQPRRHRRRCGHDLRHAPAGRTPELEELGRLARLARTDPHAQVVVAGVPTTTTEHLDALFELVDEAVGVQTILGPDPAATAAFLSATRTALQVLRQRDPHSAVAAAEAAGLLDPAGRHTPITTTPGVRYRRHNRLLGAIRLRSLEQTLSPTAQLTFRTASPIPTYPGPAIEDTSPTAWPGETSLGWIPQVLWPGVLTPWIDDEDIDARAAASMLLARVGSTRPWTVIALDLGLPASFAPVPTALITRLRRSGTWGPVLGALDDLATALEHHPPPIDYTARRWAAADPRRLRRAAHLFRTRSPGSSSRCGPDTQTLMALAWQTYTGGDLRFHPQFAHLAPTVSACSPHDGHRDLVSTLHDLAGRPDDGPAWWTPP